MTAQFTKTALAWCLNKGQMSLRGSKRRPWLEIVRPETERTYLSYQLFALRRFHDGPTDDVRDTIGGDSFYDDERIRFQGTGLEAAYSLLYPRDRKQITSQVMDITDIQGLTALWIDGGHIDLKRAGVIKGRFSQDEYEAIAECISRHGIDNKVKRSSKYFTGIALKPESMEAFARLIRPYAHFSMKAKLQLRKSPQGSGQTRSQPTDRAANMLLRGV